MSSVSRRHCRRGSKTEREKRGRGPFLWPFVLFVLFPMWFSKKNVTSIQRNISNSNVGIMEGKTRFSNPTFDPSVFESSQQSKIAGPESAEQSLLWWWLQGRTGWDSYLEYKKTLNTQVSHFLYDHS